MAAGFAHDGTTASGSPASSRSLVTSLLVVVSVVVFVRTAWMGDDAYITLRTIDNFVNGYGLRWNVAERVQAFTHPLWLMVVTAVYGVTREPYFTVIALSIGLSATVVVMLARRAPGISAASWAVAALIGSKAFVDYSTSGLENPLTHLLLIVFWILWRREAPRPVFAVWLCGGLLWLNRFDLALIVLPALAMRYRDVIARPKAVGLALAAPAAWALFALVYYGTVLPNTAYAKLQTGVSERELVAQGFLYLLNSISLDPVTLAVVAIGLIVSLERVGREWIPAAGMLLYLAYVIGIGGDFMSGRMLTPVFLLAALQVVTVRRDGGVVWAAAAAITVALSLAGPRSPLVFEPRDSFPEDVLIEPTGIADERLLYHQQGMGLLLTTRGNPIRHPFIKLGVDARTGPPVVSAMTIGMMGYYAGPSIHIVDVLGLSEPLLSRLPATPRWRIGHYFRDIPDGYLETLSIGRNVIQDTRIAMLYARVVRITRDPIWDVKRLMTIVLRR